MLVCRRYVKRAEKCHVKSAHTSKAVSESTVTLSEACNTVELNTDVIRKHDIHSYSRTCHSFQVSSINDKITIFGWRFFFVSRKWLRTAVTRATELNNVVFLNGQTQERDEATLNMYFNQSRTLSTAESLPTI